MGGTPSACFCYGPDVQKHSVFAMVPIQHIQNCMFLLWYLSNMSKTRLFLLWHLSNMFKTHNVFLMMLIQHVQQHNGFAMVPIQRWIKASVMMLRCSQTQTESEFESESAPESRTECPQSPIPKLSGSFAVIIFLLLSRPRFLNFQSTMLFCLCGCIGRPNFHVYVLSWRNWAGWLGEGRAEVYS